MPKILVIDDSGFLRHYVREILEEAGHEVEDFAPSSVMEVQEQCRSFQPDLVMTDFNMPHVDGLAVIRMVRRYAMALPIVLLTASRDPEREAKLAGYEPLWVIYKPITGEALRKALEDILAAS